MASRKEWQRLALLRLKESRVLHENRLYDGASYLAGYALELGLKARICRNLDLEAYPEGSRDEDRLFKTHKFPVLLRLAGLEKQLQQAQIDENFKANWSLLAGPQSGWSEQWRYSPPGSQPEQACAALLEALDHPTHGILTWLRKKW